MLSKKDYIYSAHDWIPGTHRIQSMILFSKPEITKNTLLIARSELEDMIYINNWYDFVVITEKSKVTPRLYEWFGKFVEPPETIITNFVPLNVNIGENPEFIYIAPELIDIEKRWQHVKKAVSISGLEQYCRKIPLENPKYEGFSEECTRCFNFFEYLSYLLGDTMGKECHEGTDRDERKAICVTEEFPSILLSIDDVEDWHGVYLCLANIGHCGNPDECGDVHHFVIYCYARRLEIINTYGTDSPIYIYQGTKTEWLYLMKSKDYSNWSRAFGLPRDYFTKMEFEGYGFNLRYRKLY